MFRDPYWATLTFLFLDGFNCQLYDLYHGVVMTFSPSSLPADEKSGRLLVVFQGFLILLILGSLGLRYQHSQKTGIVVDELVDAQFGYQVVSGFPIYSSEIPWERTPLMTYLVGFVVSGQDSVAAFLAGRKLMWAVGTLLFLMVCAASYRLYGWRLAIASPVLLLSFSTFLDRGFRIRADLLSTCLATPALLVLISPTLGLVPLSFAGLMLGLAFMTTQKAAYFVLAFACALTARLLLEHGRGFLKPFLVFGSISAIAFLLPLGLYSLYMVSVGRFEMFVDNCFFGALNIGILADTYDHTIKYFWQSFERSPQFWILGLIGIAMIFWQLLKQKRDCSPQFLALGVWTLVLVILLARHTVKYPYLYLNLAPCLALCGSLPLVGIVAAIRSLKMPLVSAFIAILTTLALSVLLLLAHGRNWRTMPSQQAARALMNRVEVITAPQDAVLDGMGLVLSRKRALPYSLTIRWAEERQKGANYPLLEMIRKAQPKVAIQNYRFGHFRPEETYFFNKHFVQDWANVYVVGQVIKHQGGQATHSLDILSDTDYALIKDEGVEVLLDGTPLGTAVFLRQGQYQLTVTGPAGEIVFKYKKAHENPPEPPEKRPLNFLTDYRF